MGDYLQAARDEAERRAGKSQDLAIARLGFREGACFEHDRILALLDADETVEAVASAIQAERYSGKQFPASNPLDFKGARAALAKIKEVLA